MTAERVAFVHSGTGIAGRLATWFAEIARQSGATVRVADATGQRARGTDVAALRQLHAPLGAQLFITVTGPDAEQIAQRLAEIVETEQDDAEVVFDETGQDTSQGNADNDGLSG